MQPFWGKNLPPEPKNGIPKQSSLPTPDFPTAKHLQIQTFSILNSPEDFFRQAAAVLQNLLIIVEILLQNIMQKQENATLKTIQNKTALIQVVVALADQNKNVEFYQNFLTNYNE